MENSPGGDTHQAGKDGHLDQDVVVEGIRLWTYLKGRINKIAKGLDLECGRKRI